MTVDALNMVKGGRVEITKDNPGLALVNAGLGWDVKKGAGEDFDLDAFALLIGADGKIKNDTDIVFFNNLEHSSESVRLSKDNRSGKGDGDDETIFMDLSKVPADVSKIVIGVAIYRASQNGQNFGMIENAYVRIIDVAGKKDLVRYNLTEDYSIETVVVVGEMYRYNNGWKFAALGTGKTGTIITVAKEYA